MKKFAGKKYSLYYGMSPDGTVYYHCLDGIIVSVRVKFYPHDGLDAPELNITYISTHVGKSIKAVIHEPGSKRDIFPMLSEQNIRQHQVEMAMPVTGFAWDLKLLTDDPRGEFASKAADILCEALEIDK